MSSPALLDIKGTGPEISDRLAELGLEIPERSRFITAGDLHLVLPRATHGLLRAPLARRAELLERLNRPPTGPDTLVIDLTEAWAWFSIQGPESSEIMAVICPLDLGPSSMSVDGATFTEIVGIKALLWRMGSGFEWAVERSHAHWVAEWLARVQSPGAH